MMNSVSASPKHTERTMGESDEKSMQEQISPEHNLSLSSPYNWVTQFILDLSIPAKRGNALLELSRRRDTVPDLAPILWYSFGTMTVLLQEIIKIYPDLTPLSLTNQSSNRVCNSLALLQCVASHPQTRLLFLNAHIPLFLYPFLNTFTKSKPFEYLRLTSLGVIGGLVKVDDSEVINFLLQTEIIPLCLRIMECGTELSKTVATFIIQKILLDDTGLRYICATCQRFTSVNKVLEGMVKFLNEVPSSRLFKQIVRCYTRLADHYEARIQLTESIPPALMDGALVNQLGDEQSKHWLNQLLTVLKLNERNSQFSRNHRMMLQSQMQQRFATRPMDRMNH